MFSKDKVWILIESFIVYLTQSEVQDPLSSEMCSLLVLKFWLKMLLCKT